MLDLFLCFSPVLIFNKFLKFLDASNVFITFEDTSLMTILDVTLGSCVSQKKDLSFWVYFGYKYEKSYLRIK